MSKKREHRGDRPDGVLLRNLDPMHFVTGIIHPNRCDNEAFISERIDLTPINEYLAKKNADDPAYKYNVFQIIVTAMQKVIILRPKMNRFIANGNYYQRKEVTAAFIVKKIFHDDGDEGLAFLRAEGEDTLDSIHDKIYRQISTARSDKSNSSDKAMSAVNKLPRFISKAFVRLMMKLDQRGRIPQSMIASDPYHASVLLSNIGSIHLKSGYHHLTNWGTTSIFVLMGEFKDYPVFDAEGNVTMRPMVDLGLTIDERIADGYYYSGSIRLLRKLLENPELLELPLNQEVDY